MNVFNNLRDANRARQIEWDTRGDITLSYAGNELAGEVGELLDAASDAHYYGSSVHIEALRQEIGDVIICCDLIAGRLDMQLEHAPAIPDFLTQEDNFKILVGIGIEVGQVCNTIKKQERARFGMAGSLGSLEDLRRNLNELIFQVHWLAGTFHIDAASCVAEKFNLTSRKYGLQTIMVL